MNPGSIFDFRQVCVPRALCEGAESSFRKCSWSMGLVMAYGCVLGKRAGLFWPAWLYILGEAPFAHCFGFSLSIYRMLDLKFLCHLTDTSE